MERELFIPECKMPMVLVEDHCVSIPIHWECDNCRLLINLGILVPVQVEGYAVERDPWSAPAYRVVDTGEEIEWRYGWVQENLDKLKVTIPKGTIFELTKIYVRNRGYGENSVTVRIIQSPEPALVKRRFMIPLASIQSARVTMVDLENV